ncbi:ATPase, T2SS/T4P/T4SS family [Phascolarctobacterium faecium]|jgi:P-type conjugative transfer ATPase TrbB|uniref:ATPase, T2SS/T4P/T4SS family n=1 Tax=Phascolarctobacterium faecium TaxID=33025 RepID=UPI0026709ADE|nr:ATPase, T2SS/T4P/T4SS family [Phascolarctobacterium faecium]
MIDTTEKRQAELVKDSLGKEILKYLDDPEVNEVYINQDYSLRIDTISGRRKTDVILTSDTVARICKSIAGINRQVITEKNPELGVEIRLLQVRAQIMFPPIVSRPTFFLRKKPRQIFSLEDYQAQGALSEKYYEIIVDCIKRRKNIIVAGATGSGKTTFLNAILKKLSEINPEHRLVILEDLPELQCSSDDVQYMTTSGNRTTSVTMQDLVFISMRLSPQRILIGEVRDKSAYDVLKAWNTGHPGGFCTIHADGCHDAFIRLELLVKEADTGSSTRDIKALIGSTVGVVISIQKVVQNNATTRVVEEIIAVKGYDAEQDCYDYDVL